MDEFEKYMEKERIQRGYVDSFVSAMKRRLNLQSLGAYIRDGSTKAVICNDSFRQREDEAFSRLEHFLNEKYGKKETDKIIEYVNTYTYIEQEIYFGLGMKAGAILQCKLTDNFETDI